MNSFLKFQGNSDSNGRGDLHWGRAKLDSAPFRGPGVPLMREEEFQEHAERVWDSKYGIFNTANPDEKHFGRTYQQVLDGILINWFQPLCERLYKWGKDDDGKPVLYAYVEWGEPYLELPPDKSQEMSPGAKTLLEGETNYGQPRPLKPGTENKSNFL